MDGQEADGGRQTALQQMMRLCRPLLPLRIVYYFAARNATGFICNKKAALHGAGRGRASVIEKVTDLPAGSDAGDEGLHDDRNREHREHLLSGNMEQSFQG